MARQVSVIGSGRGARGRGEEVGRLLAERGCVVVTGGLDEVMAAAHRGAKAAGGTTIAILPGESRADANPWADHVVVTGIGHARNLAVAASGDAVIAVGGSWGTLAEIAFAMRLGRPVVVLDGPQSKGVRAPRPRPRRSTRARGPLSSGLARDLAQAPLEEAPLRRVVRERERLAVALRGLVAAAEATEEVGAGGRQVGSPRAPRSRRSAPAPPRRPPPARRRPPG